MVKEIVKDAMFLSPKAEKSTKKDKYMLFNKIFSVQLFAPYKLLVCINSLYMLNNIYLHKLL